MSQPARRTFLTWLVGSLAVGGVGLAGWRLIETGEPDADVVARTSPLRIARADLRTDTLTVRMWRKQPVAGFLRADGRPQVLFASCTRDHCVVIRSVEEGRLACPCCGVRYGLDGAVQNGPAPRPLGSPAWKLDGAGDILIG